MLVSKTKCASEVAYARIRYRLKVDVKRISIGWVVPHAMDRLCCKKERGPLSGDLYRFYSSAGYIREFFALQAKFYTSQV